jgi:hypothetical protein
MPLPFTVRRTDPDAAAFCARSGASDRAALSAFVRGVKDLGLWESMVCWPLRSSQNSGNLSTIAYSLGGLGTFDGTLVNGPTWGADGVTFDGTTSRRITVASAVRSNYSARSFFAVAQLETGSAETAARGHIMTTYNAALTFGIFTTLSGMGFRNAASEAGSVSPASTTSYSTSNSGIAFGTRHGYSLVFDSPNLTSYKDGAFNAGNTLSNSPATISDQNFVLMDDGGNDGFGYATGVLSFACDIHVAITANQAQSLYNLYRQTLGTGLGLP